MTTTSNSRSIKQSPCIRITHEFLNSIGCQLEIQMKTPTPASASRVRTGTHARHIAFDANHSIPRCTLTCVVALALLAGTAQARAVPTDISGTYSCVGHDENLGDFRETHEFRRNDHHGAHTLGFSEAAYVDNQLAYSGEAIVDGNTIALNFASTSDKNDHGVLIGKIVAKAPLRFEGEYFESQFRSGDSGTARCTRTGN
jgi:hypothetical protein